MDFGFYTELLWSEAMCWHDVTMQRWIDWWTK